MIGINLNIQLKSSIRDELLPIYSFSAAITGLDHRGSSQCKTPLSSQFIWGNTKVFLSRPRDGTSAIWPVFTPGSPPSRARLETSTRRHPEGTDARTALTVSTSTWRNQQARFYFSSAFSTTRLVLLGDKLAAMQVDTSLATWIADYLTGRQYMWLTSSVCWTLW